MREDAVLQLAITSKVDFQDPAAKQLHLQSETESNYDDSDGVDIGIVKLHVSYVQCEVCNLLQICYVQSGQKQIIWQ